MVTVKPFSALRPNKQYAEDVSALPYDVFTREEARTAIQGKPLSFLNIDRPETQFAEDADMYAPAMYEKADTMLQKEIAEGIFMKEEKPCYYVYEETLNGRTQTGIAAVSAIDDYLNHACKEHENTVAKKEEDRIHHVDVCSAQTGPIFLAYREKNEITAIINEVKKKEPLYDFMDDQGVHTRVFLIDEEDKIKAIEKAFEEVPATYIADGHHRAASAVKVGLKRREKYPDYTGNEEFNSFLSILFPDNELEILGYHRIVKDLNGYTVESFLSKMNEVFDIEKMNEGGFPEKKGIMHMYLGHCWYALHVKEKDSEERKNDPVKTLDVSVLQEEVLSPLLTIHDPRTDSRIEFVGGVLDTKEMEERTDILKDTACAFVMYPTSIHELLNVADAGMLMPPKSTWFEPKLRSGVFIHLIER